MFVVNRSQAVVKFDNYIFVPNKPLEVTDLANLKKKYPLMAEMLAEKSLQEIDKAQAFNLAGESVKKTKEAGNSSESK